VSPPPGLLLANACLKELIDRSLTSCARPADVSPLAFRVSFRFHHSRPHSSLSTILLSPLRPGPDRPAHPACDRQRVTESSQATDEMFECRQRPHCQALQTASSQTDHTSQHQHRCLDATFSGRRKLLRESMHPKTQGGRKGDGRVGKGLELLC